MSPRATIWNDLSLHCILKRQYRDFSRTTCAYSGQLQEKFQRKSPYFRLLLHVMFFRILIRSYAILLSHACCEDNFELHQSSNFPILGNSCDMRSTQTWVWDDWIALIKICFLTRSTCIKAVRCVSLGCRYHKTLTYQYTTWI